MAHPNSIRKYSSKNMLRGTPVGRPSGPAIRQQQIAKGGSSIHGTHLGPWVTDEQTHVMMHVPHHISHAVLEAGGVFAHHLPNAPNRRSDKHLP